MSKKTKASYLAVIAIAAAFGFASFVAVAKNENARSEKPDKISQSQGKNKNNSVSLKNFEKPDKTKGQTNAQIYKEKTGEVSKNILEIAETKKSKGQEIREQNTVRNELNNQDAGQQERQRSKVMTEEEIAGELEEVAKETEDAKDETAEAIEKVENQTGFKKFLIGTDYKNLGQLRSSLVHNRNQIRKLTQIMNQVQNEGDALLLQEQLETLMQERERIKAVIVANESGFSLLGWAARFLANYEQTPIDEQEENELTEEVEEAIENSGENQEDENQQGNETTEIPENAGSADTTDMEDISVQ